MATNVIVGYSSISLKVFRDFVGDTTGATQILTVEESRSLAGQLLDAATQLEIESMSREGGNKDIWIPASGGKETPFFSRSGHRLLYCWNPSKGKHAYLDLGKDMILTDEEANQCLGFI